MIKSYVQYHTHKQEKKSLLQTYTGFKVLNHLFITLKRLYAYIKHFYFYFRQWKRKQHNFKTYDKMLMRKQNKIKKIFCTIIYQIYQDLFDFSSRRIPF